LVANFLASIDDYISDTCLLSALIDPVKVLGGWIGTGSQITAAVLEVVRKTKELHAQIEVARDAATEFALKATCASIGKLVYSLRLVGDQLAEGILHDFDTFLRESFGHTLGAVLEGDSWEQAQCNLRQGGLGIHTAASTCFPAVAGSLTGSRAAAFEWFRRIERVGLAKEGVLQGAYDDRAEKVEQHLKHFAKTMVLQHKSVSRFVPRPVILMLLGRQRGGTQAAVQTHACRVLNRIVRMIVCTKLRTILKISRRLPSCNAAWSA
jgi:hypothetical protein